LKTFKLFIADSLAPRLAQEKKKVRKARGLPFTEGILYHRTGLQYDTLTILNEDC
jgi:hypothetical protein